MSSSLYLCVRGSDLQLEMVADAVITAGSDPDCDIVLADDAVAGRHCAFEADGPELRVPDLDSQEGTFINQRRIDHDVVGARDLHGLADAALGGILENIQSPAVRAVLPGVKPHHERWDGSGYPDGLCGAGSHFEPSPAALVARLHQRGDLLPEGWQ